MIPLHEIVVGVKNGRMRLRWTELPAELRISNLHMLNHSLLNDIGRFLSEVGRDGIAQLMGFDWGLASSFPFLPRIRVGNAILRPAEWRIRPENLKRDLTLDANGFCDAFRQYRETWHMPRYVYLVEGDNRLLLDLDHATCVADLRQDLKRLTRGTPVVLLQEAVPSPDETWVTGPGGRYSSEFVVSLLLNRPGTTRAGPRGHSASAIASPTGNTLSAGRSSFDVHQCLKPPGSDWLYIKLYCAQRSAPYVIGDPLPEIVRHLAGNSWIESWFFLQYSDPDPHIRLRMCGNSATLIKEVLPALLMWANGLLEQALIHRFSLDTYEREIERYGGSAGVRLAEECFRIDSEAVVRYLHHSEAGQGPLDLIDLGVLSLDSFLTGLGMSTKDRIEFLRSVPQARADSGPEYRARQTRLTRALLDLQLHPSECSTDEIWELHRWYVTQLGPVQQSLRNLATEGQLTVGLASVFGSLAHMHCNRLLGTDQSLERLSMGLLARALESLEKRK
jgi:thiopeptide-type bacteriocin biosynthesis protein